MTDHFDHTYGITTGCRVTMPAYRLKEGRKTVTVDTPSGPMETASHDDVEEVTVHGTVEEAYPRTGIAIVKWDDGATLDYRMAKLTLEPGEQ